MAKKNRKPKKNPSTPIHEGAGYNSKYYRKSEIQSYYNKNFVSIIDEYDRYQIAGKARFIYENVGIIKGAIHEIASYSVGDSWIPSYTGDNPSWGKRATSYLSSWFDSIDIHGNDMNSVLRLISISIDRDGDVLVVFTKNSENQPRIQIIPMHAIKCRTETIQTGKYSGYSVTDGVIMDDYGVAVAYNILGDADDGSEDTQVSVVSSMLLYDINYGDQNRGYSPLGSVICDLRDYRDIRDYEREGIKLASAVGLIEKNAVGGKTPAELVWEGGMQDIPTSGAPIYYKDYEGGMIRYFSSNENGSGLEQLENNRPSQNTSEFLRDHILRGVFNALGWPLELTWNLSGLNSANTRTILSKVERKLTERQATLYKFWKRAVLFGLSVGFDNKSIAYNPTFWMWEPTYPKRASIDLGRDTKSDIDLYKIAATTLSDIYGKNGESWETKIRQVCIEKRRIKEIAEEEGVDPNTIQILVPNQVLEPVEGEDTEEENTEEEEKQESNEEEDEQ